MASVRSKAQPVGSTDWIFDENTQVSQFRGQELEDFTFAARSEVEWLNEHMLDIFSKNQVDVTEIFKTPGKLRGKTPRTARKRDAFESRPPLTDVFSTNARQAPHSIQHQGRDSTSAPAKDVDISIPPPQFVLKKPTKTNTDSGYHGLSEDDTDPDEKTEIPNQGSEEQAKSYDMVLSEQPVAAPVEIRSPSPERGTTTEGSFHSAREAPIESEDAMATSEPTRSTLNAPKQEAPPNVPTIQNLPSKIAEPAEVEAMDLDHREEDLALDEQMDESHSPSQGSSPFEPLVRKSSLTFAALPAPEPWTTKKSMGSRISRTSQLDQTKNMLGRGSYLGRFTGGKSLGASRQPEANHDVDDDHQVDNMDLDEASRPTAVREESDGDTKITQLHNKSSTQRLHDKINMLGKQPARPTKSIPASAVVSHPPYPELSTADLHARAPEIVSYPTTRTVAASTHEDDDDDWIQPPPAASKRPQLPKSTTADVMENIRGKQHIGDDDFESDHDDETLNDPPTSRPPLDGINTTSPTLARSASAAVMGSPQRTGATMENKSSLKDQTQNHPDKSATAVTPLENPTSKRNGDGPISASKSKLQSIMKTARGLFTSSAGVSAQAKIEALSSPSTRTRGKLQENSSSNKGDRGTQLNEELPPRPNDASHSNPKQVEGRKTRSSTEKEEKRKEQEARTREQEQVEEIIDPTTTNLPNRIEESEPKPTQQPRPIRQSPRRQQKQAETKQSTEESAIRSSNVNGVALGHPVGSSQAQTSLLQKPKDSRRPVKPIKDAASKPKLQTIRVGALSQQRMPPSNTALSSSLQESLPPAHTSRPGLVKKASNASIQTSASNASLKSSTSTKPKALIAAERKKEQDEKEVQRKLDQKKEIERKRAAQQEEARYQERIQREEAERQRERERSAAAEDPKKAASRQLIEKRRLELAKKEQQQRAPQRPNNDASLPQEKERVQPAPPAYRPELGGVRPPSRLHTVQDHGRPILNHPPPNPARPPIKRVLEAETDDEHSRSVRPQAGQPYQANEGKRRRTGDDEPQEPPVRPTMAPPIRQSNMRKDLNKQSIYNSYNTAPPPAGHHTSTLLKTSTIGQTYQQQGVRPGQQPHDMAKYGTARPPFADAPNPPAPTHKTPLPKHLAPPKASPQFVNGENIHLDDIPTDSDSDDSPDPAKRTMLPDWVQSPELRRLIEEQERNQNADSIFGPPQTPRMEEMFKDRHQRFRNRTSSANWTASGDRLTEEEKVADRDARERLRREGGWTFGL